MSTEIAEIQFLNFAVRESHIIFNKLSDFKIDININPKGFVFKSLNQFKLQLSVDVKDVDDNFNINIVTDAIFSYPENAELTKYIDTLFVVNAPAIVFPYVRAYISSLTALSGMPTLNLPTLNLSNVGEQLKNNIEIVE
ncbi:protein-export chaperone SecB [uncultured Flavobacterium sp.]|uniref:protein-export chaperone SecB n=1 Tax=uncultured Flavobacterium sp. TaxID=165435 RepID=UPI0030EE2EAE|tara:strand:- start:60653 stop:61069 length:417 start_codon:yes stop_codon:yes gene_type:complete